MPPVAYLDNPINAVTTKFVHTSTNKIRYPVNVVRVMIIYIYIYIYICIADGKIDQRTKCN